MSTVSIEIGNEPIVIRHDVVKQSNYLEYRDDLRFDFWYSCAYCTIMEMEATGLGFEIDHYLPKSECPDLVNEYSNLFWSCGTCNNLKRKWLSTPSDIAAGIFIIRPDRENPSMHYDLEHTRVKGRTKTGEFNIDLLLLNRLTLLRIREMRTRLSDATDFIVAGIRALRKCKLDSIKPSQRILFDTMRKRLAERREGLETALDELARDYARSSLLDEDPSKQQAMARRREYLKSVRAIGV